MLRIAPLSVALRLRLLAARFTGRELKTQQKKLLTKAAVACVLTSHCHKVKRSRPLCQLVEKPSMI